MAAAEEYKSSHSGATIDEVVTKFPSHADRHSLEGDDPILPADIGAAELGSDGKVKADQASSSLVWIETAGSTTLQATDMGKTLVCNHTGAITITIPSGLPAGSEVELIRWNSGTVTVSPGSGVELRSANNLRSIADQYGSVGLKQITTNIWVLTGSLA